LAQRGVWMSRFIDKLNQISRAVPQSMGFRAVTPASSKPKMLLVASLVEADVEGLADYVAGADAGLMVISKPGSGIRAFKKISQAVPGIPWGGWLRGVGSKEIEQVAKADFDFAVFPAATTSLNTVQNKEVGKILEVEASLGEGLLKAVDELPVDAVLIDGEKKEGLTWHHLMLFQRFADLLTKPLLVSIPSNVTANELQALWEVGVAGVIVEAGVGQPVERVSNLRKVIDELVFPPQRRQGKTEALLPYIGPDRSAVAEEEEEEE
jgi:hypothetical protein